MVRTHRIAGILLLGVCSTANVQAAETSPVPALPELLDDARHALNQALQLNEGLCTRETGADKQACSTNQRNFKDMIETTKKGIAELRSSQNLSTIYGLTVLQDVQSTFSYFALAEARRAGYRSNLQGAERIQWADASSQAQEIAEKLLVVNASQLGKIALACGLPKM
jgi:hypothetical protein